MLDWLTNIKDSISDSLAYDALKANVEAMQRDNESLISHIELLKSHVEILTANLAESKAEVLESRKRLSVLEAQNAQLGKENAHFRKKDKFDIFQGVAIKRSNKKGEYEKEPYCPSCFSFLNHRANSLTTDYSCPSCGYRLAGARGIKSLLQSFEASHKQK